MKAKQFLLCLFLTAAILMPASVSAWDWVSNTIFGFGYQLGIESDPDGGSNRMHGAFINLGGLYASANFSLSEKHYFSTDSLFDIYINGSAMEIEQSDFTLGYDFRITDWFYIPLGFSSSRRILSGGGHESYDGWYTPEEPQYQKSYGINFGIGFTLFDWLTVRATTTSFNTFFLGAGIMVNAPKYAPQPRSAPQPAPQPRPAPQIVQPRPAPAPAKNPVITSEELRRVELAYAETVRYIENCGRRLYIRNMPERNVFIRQHQGSPAAASVSAARDWKLPWYNIREISQEDIRVVRKPPVFEQLPLKNAFS